jgi:hypothetical protein
MSWVNRHNGVLTFAAASVSPVLYLAFIDRFATNSFYGDDWSVVPAIDGALKSRLSLGQLWAQYNESRLFLGSLIDTLFGLLNRFDLRSVVFFSAAIFIASYAILLALLRKYLGTRLTPIPVLVLGVMWFSLADVQNALWAFQVSWYLTVLCFVAMLFALEVPEGRRTLWFIVAAFAAFAASLSTLQGFLCWPLGAICILWSQPSGRPARREIVAWCGCTIVAVLVYFPGYDFSVNGCYPAAACSPTVALHHPLSALGFFFALIGNVIPGGIYFGGVLHYIHNVARFEVLGLALFAIAVFVLIRSWRCRTSTETFPLPLLLIVFSLLFDVAISLGRSGTGASGAANSNRYVMANLILLIGVVAYAWAHLPRYRLHQADQGWKIRMGGLAFVALALLVVVQVTESTAFGLRNGRAVSQALTDEARLVVNSDRIPAEKTACELYVEFTYQPGWSADAGHDAREDHLGEFDANSYRGYRQQGPPALFHQCVHFHSHRHGTS